MCVHAGNAGKRKTDAKEDAIQAKEESVLTQDFFVKTRRRGRPARECTQTYMTEPDDEGDAVLAEKDASGMVKLERAYGGCLGAKSR